MYYDIDKVPENKITVVNEIELQSLEQKYSPLKNRCRSSSKRRKRTFNRATTIIDDDAYQNNIFEDSRLTRLIFEKYRIVELTRFWFIIACTILTIFEFEFTFSNYISKDMESELILLNYLIFLMSIIIFLLTFVAYQIDLQYRIIAKTIPRNASIWQTSLKWSFLIEIIIILPTSNPFIREYYVTFQQRGTNEIRFYLINEILTYIMFFRLYLILLIGFKFQTYFSNRVGRICRLYQTNFGTHLMLKLTIRQFPFTTLTWLFIIGFIQYSYQLEIAERPLIRSFNEISSYNINTSLWETMIAIATVGYGDFFPYTDLGRLAMFLGLFYGVTITSLFTAILYNMLSPTNNEYLSWAVLDKAQVSKSIKKISTIIFFNISKLKHFKTLKLQSLPDDGIEMQNTIFRLEGNLSQFGMLKRMHRDIDGEEFMDMVRRKFNEHNCSLKDLKTLFIQMMTQNRKILYSIKGQDSQRKLFTNSITKSPPCKGDTTEKISKDEEFFKNLDDSYHDPYLMSFHD